MPARKSKNIVVNREAFEMMRNVGAQFANLGFNCGQLHDGFGASILLGQRELKILYDLSKTWDAATALLDKDRP